MDDSHRKPFIKRLRLVFEVCRADLPSADALEAYFIILRPHSFESVSAAMDEWMRLETYAPRPADLAKLIAGNDGRPGADEAWAQAILSIDEAATVVWSAETAQAFAAVHSMVVGQSVQGSSFIETKGEDAGKVKRRHQEFKPDMIGARRSFIEIYNRLVQEARIAGTPPRYQPSLGTDPGRRTDALRMAEARGLLPAPTVAALLPHSTNIEAESPSAKSQVHLILSLLNEAGVRREAAALARSKETERLRAISDEKVRRHEQGLNDEE